MAMPLAIVGNNFTTVWNQRQHLQIVLRVQAHFLEEDITLEELTRVFYEADLNLTGELSYLEFRKFLTGLGITHLSAVEARHVFGIVDEVRASESPTRTRPIARAQPADPRKLTLRASLQAGNNAISFFEFCHFIFPELDVEHLAQTGDIDVGMVGVPRLLQGMGFKPSTGAHGSRPNVFVPETSEQERLERFRTPGPLSPRSEAASSLMPSRMASGPGGARQESTPAADEGRGHAQLAAQLQSLEGRMEARMERLEAKLLDTMQKVVLSVTAAGKTEWARATRV